MLGRKWDPKCVVRLVCPPTVLTQKCEPKTADTQVVSLLSHHFWPAIVGYHVVCWPARLGAPPLGQHSCGLICGPRFWGEHFLGFTCWSQHFCESTFGTALSGHRTPQVLAHKWDPQSAGPQVLAQRWDPASVGPTMGPNKCWPTTSVNPTPLSQTPRVLTHKWSLTFGVSSSLGQHLWRLFGDQQFWAHTFGPALVLFRPLVD